MAVPTYTLDLRDMAAAASRGDRGRGTLHLCNAGACTWQEYGQFALDFAAAKARRSAGRVGGTAEDGGPGRIRREEAGLYGHGDREIHGSNRHPSAILAGSGERARARHFSPVSRGLITTRPRMQNSAGRAGLTALPAAARGFLRGCAAIERGGGEKGEREEGQELHEFLCAHGAPWSSPRQAGNWRRGPAACAHLASACMPWSCDDLRRRLFNRR